MAKGKRKQIHINQGQPRPLWVPPHLRKQQAQMVNIEPLQVIELDPEVKYIISFGADFERAVIQNIKIDPDQFDDIKSPEAQAVIHSVCRSQVRQAIEELQKQLTNFYKNPDMPFYLVHLGGDDFIKITKSKNEDQEEVFEVEGLEHGVEEGNNHE